MQRKLLLLFMIIILIWAGASGCSPFSNDNDGGEQNGNIFTRPKEFNLDRGKLSVLPEYNEYSADIFQVDLRSYDLTSLDIKDRFNELIHSEFDNRTKWPYVLPDGFAPKKIIESGKNPGLGIRKLHETGIDGRGVGAAIIGKPLLTRHVEYKKQLKLYKEINFESKTASEEGTAIASVMVGSTTGVAPGVDLYYIGIKPENKDENNSDSMKGNKIDSGSSGLSTAVDWIVEFNNKLPEGKKIKVLCIQQEITSSDSAYYDVIASIEKAEEKGIFVVCTVSDRIYGREVCFKGLGREALSDPDTLSSYLPGKLWANSFYTFGRYMPTLNTLFVPSDSRCTASPTGNKDYVFYPVNNWNLHLSYAAGLYALACQVKPGITPEEFISMAVKTSDTEEIKNNNLNYVYRLKNIVNPSRLIQGLQG